MNDAGVEDAGLRAHELQDILFDLVAYLELRWRHHQMPPQRCADCRDRLAAALTLPELKRLIQAAMAADQMTVAEWLYEAVPFITYADTGATSAEYREHIVVEEEFRAPIAAWVAHNHHSFNIDRERQYRRLLHDWDEYVALGGDCDSMMDCIVKRRLHGAPVPQAAPLPTLPPPRTPRHAAAVAAVWGRQ
jgi:hypothetical protein